MRDVFQFIAIAFFLFSCTVHEEPNITPTPPPQSEEGPSPTPGSAMVSGKSACEEDEVFISPGVYTVGEWDDGRLDGVSAADVSNFGYVRIPATEVSIPEPGICIGKFPFHGISGGPWSIEGLAESELENFSEQVLWPTGRDFCDLGTLMVSAAASENFRYPYGNQAQSPEAAICDTNPEYPTKPIGGFESCVSGFKLHDYQVRTMWFLLDVQGEDLILS